MATPNEDTLKIEHRKRDDRGSFVVLRAGEELGEMTYSLSSDRSRITIHHTGVSKVLEGQGIGKKLVVRNVIEGSRRRTTQNPTRDPYGRREPTHR